MKLFAYHSKLWGAVMIAVTTLISSRMIHHSNAFVPSLSSMVIMPMTLSSLSSSSGLLFTSNTSDRMLLLQRQRLSLQQQQQQQLLLPLLLLNRRASSSTSSTTTTCRHRGGSRLWSTPVGGTGGGRGNFLGRQEDEDDDEEDDDEDEDDEDEDDDVTSLRPGRYSGSSPFTGLKLDPWDPKPLIKPRPSRFFRDKQQGSEWNAADEKLIQTMTPDERRENLTVMRQIRKSDLPDLRMRKDHAGWVEANNDLKRRFNKDPWFGVNERLRDAIQLGENADKIKYLQDLAMKLGGPPPGIEIGSRGYAVHTEIYDIGITPSRATGLLEFEIRAERSARGRAMMAERRKNLDAAQRQYEEDMRNPGVREDREAKERRERTMRRMMDEIEQDNQKKRERAKEILGKVPETPESRTKSMEKALQQAREEVKKIRRKQLGKGSDLDDDYDNDDEDDDEDDDDDAEGARRRRRRPKSGADRAREAAAAEASGGRPRLPGDPDVTRGEIKSVPVRSYSSTTTGPLLVEVTSSYNAEQSDPPMRKHCFQYTIRITNNSPTDTIQLLGRRFEIQTVGSSMKDVVQGEGVTGRTPILKPGEVFEYTSTAPLSVRPIGTTEIAARMRGEYRYTVLTGVMTDRTGATIPVEEAKAELGTFHFIFPEDQRVKPFQSAEGSSSAEDDDDEDDEDGDDSSSRPSRRPSTASSSTAATASAGAVAAAGTGTASLSSASVLTGDADMRTGDIAVPLNDASETVTDGVRVKLSTSYRPERSDNALDKHCFAYNIRITNESSRTIQLVSRRFEIQTIGSATKDVVQGPGVTGRQPILKPGESFEYTSTAPLSVKPMSNKTPVVARMQGEYNFVVLGDDGITPMSSTPLQAKLGMFHFILPAIV